MSSVSEYQKQQRLKSELQERIVDIAIFENMDDDTRDRLRTGIQEFEEEAGVPRGTFAIKSIVFSDEDNSVTVTLKNRWVFTVRGMLRV